MSKISEHFIKFFAKLGALIVVGGIYFSLFWGLPIAAFNNPWILKNPEAMGCTFTEYVVGFHLLIICIVWGSWGIEKLTRTRNKS